MTLSLEGIRLQLAPFRLELDLSIGGGWTAVLGPSGAGKTTILELVAGLRRPEEGIIRLAGRVLTDGEAGFSVPARRRGFGYVTQDDTLFPHRSVRGNVYYAKPRPAAKDTIEPAHVIGALQIESLLDRRIEGLSGGERRRVALARALLSHPDYLLLDEPLTGLDAELRRQIIAYLSVVKTEFSIPTIYVTHSGEEVEALCDEVVSIENGTIRGRSRL
jgi:molybdate transport system ATP-binding protein